MRTCSRCQKTLPELSFNWKVKNVKRSYHCRECASRYVKAHYDSHIEYYVDKAKKRNKKILLESRNYIRQYLQKHPCLDCGETNIVVLEFDHRDKSMKHGEISTIIKRFGSLDKLINEIGKCDIRCANCHRIKTAKESNSWKLMHP